MKDQKQEIEEMQNEICINCVHVMDCEDSLRKICVCGSVAQILYKSGYRKQIVGKWVSASQKTGVNIGMKCAICGARIKYSEFFNGNHNFCHKCGAKMKGTEHD